MRSVLFSLLLLFFAALISLSSPLAAPLPDGCAGQVTEPFSSGFVAADFDLHNVEVDVAGVMSLQTAS